MLKYKYIFQIKYTEAILSNSTWKLIVWSYQNVDCSLKNEFVLLIIILGIRSLWAQLADSGAWVYVRMKLWTEN